MMRLLVCLLLILQFTTPAMAGGAGTACPATPTDLVVAGYQKVATNGDEAGYQQLVYGGADSSFSVTDFLNRDRAGADRKRVVESLARQLLKQSGDGTVQQVNQDRVDTLGLNLVALLYTAHDNDTVTRVEAGAVAHRDGCYSVLRYSHAGDTGRNASLDAYLALVGDWHRQTIKR